MTDFPPHISDNGTNSAPDRPREESRPITVPLPDEGPAGESDAAMAARLPLVVGRLSRRVRIDARGSLPPLQLSTLATLDEHGPQQRCELARREGVAKSTMSRVLTALDRKHLIRRDAVPTDRRGLLVSLTTTGTNRLRRACGRPTGLLRRRLDLLDPTHQAALQEALPALEALLEHDDEGWYVSRDLDLRAP